MSKASRWSQWVIAESADPRIQLPWTASERLRRDARLSSGRAFRGGKAILSLTLPRSEPPSQPLH
ncbi:hypothetical protein [Pararhodobacter oceanensis]|uniref:Uncharacterized protein n=1 Tax=Pararhodobacter oceanensis TaxID=2172121 RepID=A0A2T8HUF8_9RHOB|nr:hypothetical protein [Pararhodobacter oceanensis]PVH29100.1 hypothetical protein DDE20_08740 [Pararhodobacter oceanensis]